MTSSSSSPTSLVELTADVVSAYVSWNRISAADLFGLVGTTHAALSGLTGAAPITAEARLPAVPVKKSVTPDYLVCLEDGKKFKSLKRHLRARYGLTPEAYREKWALPTDYPMVAPNYAKARSALARETGLGQQRRKAA